MSQFYSESLGLSTSAFALLKNLIHERIGLEYDEDKRDLLADRLSPLVVENGFDAFLDYYYLLKYDEAADVHWDRLMDALSVQETYFWREMDQVHALVNDLVPEHAKSRPNEPIRIWSAACATGEEPLTIAMALEEANWFQRVPVEIRGSDASPSALQKASLGMYRDRSFRNLPAHLKRRYFSEGPSGCTMNEGLRGKVQFRKANLLSATQIASLAQSSYIFCRNVFIYFSRESIKRVVDIFYEHMPSPGYLFIGASESLLKLGTGFEVEEIGGAFVYVKR